MKLFSIFVRFANNLLFFQKKQYDFIYFHIEAKCDRFSSLDLNSFLHSYKRSFVSDFSKKHNFLCKFEFKIYFYEQNSCCSEKIILFLHQENIFIHV
jgi:hypothetical protein